MVVRGYGVQAAVALLILFSLLSVAIVPQGSLDAPREDIVVDEASSYVEVAPEVTEAMTDPDVPAVIPSEPKDPVGYVPKVTATTQLNSPRMGQTRQVGEQPIVVTFDDAHNPFLSVDVKNPVQSSGVAAPMTMSGGHSQFADSLKDRFEVRVFDRETPETATQRINFDTIAGTNIMIVPAFEATYTKSEGDTLANHVRGGGGAIIMGYEGLYGISSQRLVASLGWGGMKISLDGTTSLSSSHILHPSTPEYYANVTEGINSLSMFKPAPLETPAPGGVIKNVTVLAKIGVNNYIVAFEYYKGVVVLVADTFMFSNNLIGNGDNYQLGQNILDWMVTKIVVPEYSVELDCDVETFKYDAAGGSAETSCTLVNSGNVFDYYRVRLDNSTLPVNPGVAPPDHLRISGNFSEWDIILPPRDDPLPNARLLTFELKVDRGLILNTTYTLTATATSAARKNIKAVMPLIISIEFLPIYGVDLQCKGETVQFVGQGEEAVFEISLRNLGNIGDTITVSQSTPMPGGWGYSFDPLDVLYIPLGATYDIQLHVTTPPVGGGVPTLAVKVNAQASGDSPPRSCNLQVRVGDRPNFELLPVDDNLEVYPGELLDFRFQLLNKGTKATGDPVDLFPIDLEPGWNATFKVDDSMLITDHLIPFEVKEYVMTLEVPSNALAGYRTNFRIMAESQGTSFDPLLIQVYVKEQRDFKIDIPPTMEVNETGERPFTMYLNNTGNSNETVVIQYVFSPGWQVVILNYSEVALNSSATNDTDDGEPVDNVTISPYGNDSFIVDDIAKNLNMRVNPFSKVQVKLIIVPNATTETGEYDFKVNYIGERMLQGTEDSLINVNQRYHVDVDFLLESRITYRGGGVLGTMVVRNLGNGPDIFRLAPESSSGDYWSWFNPEVQQSIALEPYETRRMDFSIEIPDYLVEDEVDIDLYGTYHSATERTTTVRLPILVKSVDLLIEKPPNMVPEGTLVERETVTVITEVHNQGEVKALGISVALFVDDDEIPVWKYPITQIRANNSAYAYLFWPAEEGDHTLRVLVDWDKKFDELDEANNDRELFVTVLSQAALNVESGPSILYVNGFIIMALAAVTIYVYMEMMKQDKANQ